jgi:hypothetical protein
MAKNVCQKPLQIVLPVNLSVQPVVVFLIISPAITLVTVWMDPMNLSATVRCEYVLESFSNATTIDVFRQIKHVTVFSIVAMDRTRRFAIVPTFISVVVRASVFWQSIGVIMTLIVRMRPMKWDARKGRATKVKDLRRISSNAKTQLHVIWSRGDVTVKMIVGMVRMRRIALRPPHHRVDPTSLSAPMDCAFRLNGDVTMKTIAWTELQEIWVRTNRIVRNIVNQIILNVPTVQHAFPILGNVTETLIVWMDRMRDRIVRYVLVRRGNFSATQLVVAFRRVGCVMVRLIVRRVKKMNLIANIWISVAQTLLPAATGSVLSWILFVTVTQIVRMAVTKVKDACPVRLHIRHVRQTNFVVKTESVCRWIKRVTLKMTVRMVRTKT